MAKKKTASRRADAPEVTAPAFPKSMVKITRNAGGGFDVAEQKVTDVDAEASALENGFHPVAEIVTEPEIVAYPAWRYKKGQPPRVVQTEAEDDTLDDGWIDSPAPDPEPVGINEPDPDVAALEVRRRQELRLGEDR